jgi:hypothetical protein
MNPKRSARQESRFWGDQVLAGKRCSALLIYVALCVVAFSLVFFAVHRSRGLPSSRCPYSSSALNSGKGLTSIGIRVASSVQGSPERSQRGSSSGRHARLQHPIILSVELIHSTQFQLLMIRILDATRECITEKTYGFQI